MKGIVFAGESDSRLYPLTAVVSKQLLPVFDKPMIYYPLSTLMLAGIREILIITTPQDQPLFKRLLDDGSKVGLSISYTAQEAWRGLADAFILGRNFIGTGPVALVQGDNIFYGNGLTDILSRVAARTRGATIFGYEVTAPTQYSVVELDSDFRALSIEDKPRHPKSNAAITGLYFYDNDVVEIATDISNSARAKLEITDVNRVYLGRGDLNVELLGRDFAWLDGGTHSSLVDAGHFVQILEQRQGLRIACPEEIALRQGYITLEAFEKLAQKSAGSSYGEYLMTIYRSFKR